MDNSRILVTGFPVGTTKQQLTIYFQSERDSGGGDVDSIEIDRGKAYITFEEVEAANRVVRRGDHRLQNCQLQVKFHPDPEDDEDECFIESNVDRPEGYGQCQYNELQRFENRQMGYERRQEPQAASQHLDRTPKRHHNESRETKVCTVQVTGLLPDTSKELLTYYFENYRRSKGGPVSTVDRKPDLQTCFITFKNPEDAIRIVENSPHTVSGLCLDVSLVEERESDIGDDYEESTSRSNSFIRIIVSGISSPITNDSVRYYFENSRRSGGGDIFDIDFTDDEKAVITFRKVEDLQRLLQKSHYINGKTISVIKQPPKKKVPLDPIRVQVRGLNEEITEDCLLLYLDKYSDIEVKQVIKGCNNNAMAIFTAEPDFKSLFDRVHGDKKGPEGCKLRLERVPVCSCILVEGLNEKTSKETILLYFESNRRSGGDIVSHVECITKSSALVHFEDASTVKSVMGKRVHKLEEKQLDVKPYYPFLDNSTTSKMEMPFDADVFEHIKINHDRELQILSEENKVDVSMDPEKQVVIMSHSEKINIPQQLWRERTGRLQSFLQGFKKTEIRIAAELCDEISERWRKDHSSKEPSANLVSFSGHNRLARILGKAPDVNDEERKLKEFILAVEKDAELMKSIGKVSEDGIPRSRLRLLEMSGICQKLQSEHQYLNISIDMDGGTLSLDGPRILLKDVKGDVFTFISKMIDKTIELPTNIINVLKKPLVSSCLQNLLKQKGIQAIFDYDQGNSSNEIKIIGVDANTIQEAEKTLLAATQENSIRLTDENTQVLSSRLWKNFHTALMSEFKVGIIADIPSSTVWVSGIAEDVKECYDQIIDFLQKNTILCDTVSLDHGSTRFVFERLGSKLDEVKKDLVTCSVDMRVASNYKGIDVSGTAEGIEKCVPRLVDLAKTVHTISIPIDKPGMKKFFSQGKGSKSLKTIEDINNCIIIPRETNEASLTSDEAGEKEFDRPSGKFICSYLTKEGKTISVFKDDITKHRVDAIVNPANENLQHVGGVALAIVQAGGNDIQLHCNQYVEANGRLLEGRTLVTPAGILPCSKIIHTVGPRWDSMADTLRRDGTETPQERLLKLAIRNTLKEAASLKSIAIPAVSSGVFGVPRDLCAEVILDVIVEFCQANPSCSLAEIHLVNHDTPTVKVFSDEMRNRFAEEKNFIDKENPALAIPSFGVGNSAQRPEKAPRSFTTPEGIRITLTDGDLAKKQANILVGTAAGNLKLDQNPCAMALSNAAGQCLQNEASTKSPVAVGDIAVLNQTGRLTCQAVIFAICSDWGNGKGRKILKELLTKCLKEGDRRNSTSIAFAAIGTGILRFPRDQVAKIYFDEVISYSQRNPNTKVKDVRFVLYDKDTPTVQAFDAELKKRLKNTGRTGNASQANEIATSATGGAVFSPVTERKPDHLQTNIGSLCFQVQPGDITKDSTEAIAVISNTSLDLSVGQGAGAAVLNKGGPSIRDECAKYAPKMPGSIVATTAGRLKASSLFHIVPVEPITAKSIKVSLLKCLREAENRKVTSISFPAIGTGVLGISAKSCAHSMLSAIRDFSNQAPVHVQLVKMTIFQKDMIKDVRSAMFEESGQKPPAEPGMFRKFTAGLKTMAGYIGLGGNEGSSATPEVQSADNTKLNLEIYAGCESDLRQASTAVNELMAAHFTQQVIKSEAIKNLTKGHMTKIHTLELRYQVEAVVEKEADRIELRGQLEDILKVMSDIHELLDQIKNDENERIRAEVLSRNVQWKFKLGDKFEEYKSDLNAQIELAYHQKRRKISVTQDGVAYEISFVNMTENDEHGNSTEIKRFDSRSGLQVPDYWDPQPQDKTVYTVEITPTSHAQEYKKVSNLFSATCSSAIVKIERIQNPTVYGFYAIQQQKMDESNGPGSNEKLLFHGTAEANCQAISHKGFNRSYSWQKSNLYGKGVYFAEQANYSASSQFSPPGPTGLRHMYLARVLVGEYTVGKRDILVPPSKTTQDPTDTYDSVVDQMANPEIFVVFHDSQCYPEYLITFQ